MRVPCLNAGIPRQFELMRDSELETRHLDGRNSATLNSFRKLVDLYLLKWVKQLRGRACGLGCAG